MTACPAQQPGDHATYDFVIAGAGSAGCVLAARLSENPAQRVVLLEAGGPATDPAIADPLQWPHLQGSAVDWGWQTEPQQHTAGRRHAWPRGKVIGGSSCINAMAHVRGHPDDFEAWVQDGCPGWGFADLLPYFIKSESSSFCPSPYHGDSGPLHLITPADPHPITQAYCAAAEEQGLAPIPEHNAEHLAGPTLNTLAIKDGRRQTVADAYLPPAVLARPNLTVLSDCLVQRLLLDRGHCRGVELHSRTAPDSTTLYAAQAVVLSAGALGSPALLLRSGIGPADNLRQLGITVQQDLPGVGQNLQDHLLAGGNVYLARRPVPVSRSQHSESLLYINLAAASQAPEIVLACVTVPVTTEMFTAPSVPAYTIMFGFTHPRSRGTLTLRSADPLAAPRIDPNYLAEAVDREHFRQALQWARTIGHATALADWREREYLPAPADLSNIESEIAFLQRAAYTHHHPVGTCRMGLGQEAVCDQTLAVHGVSGLYIVDASVMPSLTTGPVHAALIALAERASDILQDQPVLAPIILPRPQPA